LQLGSAALRDGGPVDAAVHCGTSSLRSKNFLRSKVRYKIFSRKSDAPQHTSLTLRTTSGFDAVVKAGKDPLVTPSTTENWDNNT
jgi:hypothetical protein